jgi:hypothetical protein
LPSLHTRLKDFSVEFHEKEKTDSVTSNLIRIIYHNFIHEGKNYMAIIINIIYSWLSVVIFMGTNFAVAIIMNRKSAVAILMNKIICRSHILEQNNLPWP